LRCQPSAITACEERNARTLPELPRLSYARARKSGCAATPACGELAAARRAVLPAAKTSASADRSLKVVSNYRE
jgi:hypothetical protein